MSMVKSAPPSFEARHSLPQRGMEPEALRDSLTHLATADRAFASRFRFGKRFYAGDDVLAAGDFACGLFSSHGRSQPYPGARNAPGLERMKREVTDAVLTFTHAPADAHAEFTSGGTESTILALRACLQRALAHGKQRSDCEVVAPWSVHPCFDKAADLLGIRLQRIPPARECQPDYQRIEDAITDRTIMIVASCPSYPFGLVDDVAVMADIAARKGVWLHVDACMSGFLAPFMELNGVRLPASDFRVGGVDSICLDLHKHGYAAKGASLVLFRSAALAQFAEFRYCAHPFAQMVTSTLAGTAPAAPIAAAWAVMQYLGVDGYRKLAAQLSQARSAFLAAIAATRTCAVFGDPLFSVIAFGTGSCDSRQVTNELLARGWFVLHVNQPEGIQMNFSVPDGGLAPQLSTDLIDITATLKP